MNKKILLAFCAVTAAAAIAVGITACNGGSKGMTEEDAKAKIATFTTTPSTVNATFKQTYKLDVKDDRPGVKAFEKDVDATVTIQADYTAGNLYYYGKKVAKDNSVTEELVVKESSTYYYLTTTTVKKELENEAAAKAKIDELITALTKETAGYLDGGAFVYGADWVNTYLLLGSTTITGKEKTYFTYAYDKAEGDGLKVDVDMKYIGYYGDAGTFEFGTDSTHTGAKATIETDSKGYITSFNQTLNNHLDMNIMSPAVPLDLTGTRSLTATYNGAITKKTAGDVSQTLAKPTVSYGEFNNATVSVFDFVSTTQMTPVASGGTVEIGHYIAVMVTPAEGYEVNEVTIGGATATAMGPAYVLMVTEDDYNRNFEIKVKAVEKGAEETPATIVVGAVENATVKTYDLQYPEMIFTESTTVAIGHFAAITVECAQGYDVEKVTFNGANATYMGGYYLVFAAATSGQTINVVVTTKPA